MEKVGDWVKRAFWLVGVGLVAYLGEHGRDGGFLQDIWAGAKTASPFATMVSLWLLLDERRERREAQRQCNERTVDFIESTNLQSRSSVEIVGAVKQMAAALPGFATSFGSTNRKRKRR